MSARTAPRLTAAGQEIVNRVAAAHRVRPEDIFRSPLVRAPAVVVARWDALRQLKALPLSDGSAPSNSLVATWAGVDRTTVDYALYPKHMSVIASALQATYAQGRREHAEALGQPYDPSGRSSSSITRRDTSHE
jgi:hypothetical protein